MTSPLEPLPDKAQEPVQKYSALDRQQAELLDAWFEGNKGSEAFSAQAFALVEAHFQRAGLTARLPEPVMRRHASSWMSFSWHLFYALWGPIESGDKDDLVKAVFADLAAYSLQSRPNSPAWRFAVLLWEFWERKCLNPRVISLLPEVVLAEWPRMQQIFDAWQDQADERENEMIRMGQMGY